MTNSLTPLLTTNTLLMAVQFGGDTNEIKGTFWGDGMVRIAGREYNGMLESPCYTHADETHKLSCMSCHQLHRKADDPRPLE